MQVAVIHLNTDELLTTPFATLVANARSLALEGHGSRVSYSRKVFIPLTRLCRDVCHYCTFATTPNRLPAPQMRRSQSAAISRPPPTQMPWICATSGWRHAASAAAVRCMAPP